MIKNSFGTIGFYIDDNNVYHSYGCGNGYSHLGGIGNGDGYGAGSGSLYSFCICHGIGDGSGNDNGVCYGSDVDIK